MADAIHHTTLKNGLRVIAQKLHGISGVGISVNYRVGFRTEFRSRSGFAHLFEHMMFQGSRNVSRGEHFARIQAFGGTVNANTFPDSTDYYQVVPSSALEHVLELEADRMGFLDVTQDALDTQRDVVKEEIRLQVAGRPYGGFPWTVLPSVLYRKWENAHNGYGELTDLNAATVTDCAEFFDAFYAPGNAVLAMCGDIDPRKALEAAQRCFARVPARTVPHLPDISEPLGHEPLSGTCYDPLAPRPALAMGCRLPDAATDLSTYAAHVALSHLLTSGAGARLRSALAPLGAQVDSATGLFGPLMVKDPDTFVIVVHHPPGLADEVVSLVTEQAAKVADGAARGVETQRAIATAVSRHYQNLDSLAHRVRSLARGALLFDQPGIAEELARAVARTKTDSLATAAAALAQPNGRAVLALIPEEAKETAA
ncbi:M16 family metallopeptidase [Streptomyces sp. NPDC057623]|uniref:M16 family metallopeptidase n=1 Tax=Streptomyces sp. NPDC057623 TaxID=3346187 RepID=UPI0036BA536D